MEEIKRLLLRSFSETRTMSIINKNVIKIQNALENGSDIDELVEVLMCENYQLWKADVINEITTDPAISFDDLPDPQLRCFFDDLITSQKVAEFIIKKYHKDVSEREPCVIEQTVHCLELYEAPSDEFIRAQYQLLCDTTTKELSFDAYLAGYQAGYNASHTKMKNLCKSGKCESSMERDRIDEGVEIMCARARMCGYDYDDC